MSISSGSESTILPTSAPAASSFPVQEMVGCGKAWGLCTAVDLQDCNPDLIRNADHIKRYVVELCEVIGMKRFGECQVVNFGEGRVAGYSMVQLISTSLISGHFAMTPTMRTSISSVARDTIRKSLKPSPRNFWRAAQHGDRDPSLLALNPHHAWGLPRSPHACHVIAIIIHS